MHLGFNNHQAHTHVLNEIKLLIEIRTGGKGAS